MKAPPAIPARPDTTMQGIDPESDAPAQPSHPLRQLGFAYGLTFAVVAALAWLL